VKTAVLLGAGASRDADIPTVTEMTQAIYDLAPGEPYRSREAERLRRALGTVIGGLTFQKGIRGENPYGGLNVEEVFASVQMLANRSDIGAAPFIGSWHSVIDELEEEPTTDYEFDRLYRATRDGIAEELRKIAESNSSPLRHIQSEYRKQLRKKNPEFNWGKWIGDALAGVFKELKGSIPPSRAKQDFRKRLGGIVRRDPDSRRGRIFQRLSEQMILSLRDLVWLKEGHDVSYLEPLLNIESDQLSIYSLNYDNAIERLCQQKDVSYSVGITESGTIEFDPDAKIHLIKLHGSIDWMETIPEIRGSDTTRPLPLKGIRLATAREVENPNLEFRPAVIFGQGNKLTTEGPYLELLRLFRSDLDEHDNLLTVGYSFRDPHINQYIAQWFNDEPNRRVIILNGKSFAHDVKSVALRVWTAPMMSDRPFIQDLVRYGGRRVQIVPDTAANGLNQAVDMIRGGLM
jgi:hypothetical protein